MTKKILTIILIGIMLTSIFALAEEDIDQNQQAEELKELGLFKGSDKGFELERPPKRIESAVMLVRLLGKETEVLEGEYNHPFNDVPAWADKYVGYMYEKGLTKGISEDKFGSDNLTDLKSYSTFVLRTLGYDDTAGDFSWASAAEKAQEVGILAPEKLQEMNKDSFLRGDMVEISYNTLKTSIKERNETLAQELINKGAIDSAKAKSLNLLKDVQENSELNYIDLTITKENGEFKAELDREQLPEEIKSFSNIINSTSNTFKEKEDIKFIYLILDKTRNFPSSSMKREKTEFTITSYKGNYSYVGLYENNQLKGMIQVEYPEDEGVMKVPIYIWDEDEYHKYASEVMEKIEYTVQDAEYIESDKFEIVHIEKADKYFLVDTVGILDNKEVVYVNKESGSSNVFDALDRIRDNIKRDLIYNGDLLMKYSGEIYNKYHMNREIDNREYNYNLYYFFNKEKKVVAYTFVKNPKANDYTYNQIKLTLTFQDEYDSYIFNNEEIKMDVFADGEKILEVKGEYVYDMNGNKIDNYAFEKIVQNEDYTVDLYYFYIYPHGKDITVTVDTSYEYKVDILK